MHRQKETLDPKYIVFFILKFCGFVVAGFGFFGLATMIFLNRKIGPSYLEGISSLNQLQNRLPFILFITAFIQGIILCLLALLIALLWSHSVAGPLVRFRRHLRDIAQGRFLKEPVTFRTADQLHGLALAFSELMMAHKDNSVKTLSLFVKAQKIIDECKILKDQKKYPSNEFDLKLRELKNIYRLIQEIYRPKIG